MTFSEISDQNTNLQINVGDKVSLLFDQSIQSANSNKVLTATLMINPQESEKLDLEDRVWIQIGENSRVFGRKTERNEDFENELLFS